MLIYFSKVSRHFLEVCFFLFNNSISRNAIISCSILITAASLPFEAEFSDSVTIVSSNSSPDTAGLKFYPLMVGNSWAYNTFINSNPTGRVKKYVTDSVWIGSHLYYNIYSRNLSGNVSFDGAFRVDSIYGRILVSTSGGCSWTPNEMIVDSLRASLNDSFNVSCTIRGICYAIGTTNLFGNQVQSISHRHKAGDVTYQKQYARNFGVYYSSSSYTVTLSSVLTGCTINGQVYGDTTLVGMTSISSEIPERFLLGQNYPNPFNPVTSLRFQIPEASSVKITLYNIDGEQISTILDLYLNPGIYEVDFNGSALASGVYFYRMVSGRFAESRKMLLIK